MYSPLKCLSSPQISNNNKFNIFLKKQSFVFNPAPEGMNDLEWLREGINRLVYFVKEGSLPSDKVGFTFRSKSFGYGDVYAAFKPISEIGVDTIFEAVCNSLQCNRNVDVLLSCPFEFEITRVKMPITGNGLEPSNPDHISIKSTNCNDDVYKSFLQFCKIRRGIVQINNDENMSLPKALVVGIALVMKDPDYEVIRKDSKKRQTNRAKIMLAEIPLVIPKSGAGISEVKKFEDFLKDFNIKVYNYTNEGSKLIYESNCPNRKHEIRLLQCNGHYNLITKNIV